jgi:hypothetical protein
MSGVGLKQSGKHTRAVIYIYIYIYIYGIVTDVDQTQEINGHSRSM